MRQLHAGRFRGQPALADIVVQLSWLLCCVSAVLKAVQNVNDIIAPALVGKVSGFFIVLNQSSEISDFIW